MRILLLIALPIEVCGFDFNHKDVDVVFTGVGKLNAYRAASKAIREKHYDYVINAGTCGSAKHEVSHILFPSVIRQGDAFATDGFKSKIYRTKKVTVSSVKEASILSSDNFISFKSEIGDTNIDMRDDYDAFDMESYAIANALDFMLDNITFIKIVSDNLDGTSSDWESSAKRLSPILARCIRNFIQSKFIPDYEIRRI